MSAQSTRSPSGARSRVAAEAEPGDQRPRPDIRADQPVRALDRGDLHVIDAHDALAVHIDDLAVEHIAAEEDFAVAPLEAADIQFGGGEGDAVRVDAGDGTDRDEEIAPPLPGDDAGDGRVALAHARDEVANGRDPLAVPVTDRGIDEL